MNNGTPKRNLVKFGKWAGFGLLMVAASCVQVPDGAYDYRAICSIDVDCEDAHLSNPGVAPDSPCYCRYIGGMRWRDVGCRGVPRTEGRENNRACADELWS